jgi:guanylate kinase
MEHRAGTDRMTTEARERGILLVVSSPSGAGKTTLCRRLMAEFSRITFSVSYTTRPRRQNEREGIDYHFVDDAAFSAMVSEDAFAEWARVHGHRYGTSRATVEENLAAGRDLLFDIDWQGGQALNSKYPDETVMVFVLPPTLEELASRLKRRGTDSAEVVERRLAKAKEELSHYGEYHYLLPNVDLEEAYQDLRAIYKAARRAQKRQAFRALRLLEEVRTSSEQGDEA